MTTTQFHDLMRAAALDEGLSVTELAKRACTTRADIYDWLDGDKVPSKMEVKRMFGKHHRIVYYVPKDALPPPADTPDSLSEELEAEAEEFKADVGATLVALGQLTEPLDVRLEGEDEGEESKPPPELTESDREVLDDLFKPEMDPSFGKVLWKLREAANVTQREVAELIGVAHTVVSRWESDEMLPIQDHYDRLCMIFTELTRYARPPVRDIAKPGFEPGSYDSTPAPAERSPMTEPPHRVTIEAPAAAPAEHGEHAPRAPDGLMLLADALDLANLLWPNTKPHVGQLSRGEGEWTIRINIGTDGVLSGAGSVPALALGQVRMALREEIAKRKALVDEEERRMREAMQKKRDVLSELLAYVGEV